MTAAQTNIAIWLGCLGVAALYGAITYLFFGAFSVGFSVLLAGLLGVSIMGDRR